MEKESNYEPGFYLTQSGYLVLHRKRTTTDELFTWLYFDKYMVTYSCTFRHLLDLYGEDEFPLRKCDEIEFGVPVKHKEPKEDGFYVTQSGSIVRHCSSSLFYTWSYYDEDGFLEKHDDNWCHFKKIIGEHELPLRKITKDGLEPVND